MPMKFSVVMPTFEDYHGVYMTVKNLTINRAEWVEDITVVDNKPSDEEGTHGHATKRLCADLRIHYVPYTEKTGTAAAKNYAMTLGRSPYKVCMDSHVFVHPSTFPSLEEFYLRNPDKQDHLLQGPIVWDNEVTCATHFKDVWPVDLVDVKDAAGNVLKNPDGTNQKRPKPSEMWGQWDRDYDVFPLADWEKGVPGSPFVLSKPTVKWFKIFAMGMGFFACRGDAWLGFNPRFKGFGGEECYIQEKFRKHGKEAWCVTGALWTHRFGRPGGSPHVITVWDKYRNYEIGLAELGIDPARLRDHFITGPGGHVPPTWPAAALRGDLMPPGETVVYPAVAVAQGGNGPDVASEDEMKAIRARIAEDKARARKMAANAGLSPAAAFIQEEAVAKSDGCSGCRSGDELPLPEGDSLELEYARVVNEPGDINEHLPTLRGLVEAVGPSCRVVELGTRDGVSTTALLAGKPRSVVTVDLNRHAAARRLAAYKDDGTTLEFVQADSRAVPATECDLLFVDTDPHTAEQITAELKQHGPLCRRFIALHDTSNHFAETTPDGKAGTMPAIRLWLKASSEWTMVRRDLNNNGLVVLSRDDRDKKQPPALKRKALNIGWAVLKHIKNMGRQTPEEEFNKRIETCLECPARFGDVCGDCGCPLLKKAAWYKEECPRGKWPLPLVTPDAPPGPGDKSTAV